MVALIRREFRKRFSPSSFSAHLSWKFRGSIGLEEGGGKEKKSWRDATVASSMMTRRDVIFIVLINQ